MRIGLIDVDGHNFPNLALMKLSAWHKAQGDMVEWWSGFSEYDRVYMSKIFFVWHVQWLTSERDRRQQTWATKNLISYSRTAYRLTIDIPDSRWKKLMKALDWVSVFPDGDRKIVTEWPGADAWYVYLGKIPPKWIVGCRRMEGTR